MSRRVWHAYRPGSALPTLAVAARTRLGAWIAWRSWCRNMGVEHWSRVTIKRGDVL